jgi:hypothetical protein
MWRDRQCHSSIITKEKYLKFETSYSTSEIKVFFQDFTIFMSNKDIFQDRNI